MMKARVLWRGVWATVAAVLMVLGGGLPGDDGGMAWEYYMFGEVGMEWTMAAGATCLGQAAWYMWTGWGAIIGAGGCMVAGWA